MGAGINGTLTNPISLLFLSSFAQRAEECDIDFEDFEQRPLPHIFVDPCSCAKPAQEDVQDNTPEGIRSGQVKLRYILAVSRFAHYIKCIICLLQATQKRCACRVKSMWAGVDI